MMLVVGNKLQIQSKDTLNPGCSMTTCGVGPIPCQAMAMSCIDATAHVKLRCMGKSWFLDVNPGRVADKATTDTAEAAEPAAAIIDPGGVTLCGGPVSLLGAHDHNAVFGMSDTANSSIVKSSTCTCADFVGADQTTIDVGAIRKASAITVGTFCSKSAWEMEIAYPTNEAYREAISWADSTQQKSSTEKWYCSLIKHEAFEVVNHNDFSSVWHLDRSSTSDTRSSDSVGGVPAAHADPYAPAVGTDTNAPAVGAVNPVEALSNAYDVTVNTAVRAHAPVGDPGYVDIQPFNDFATIGLLCIHFSGHCSESAWEIETDYCANEAGGESHKKTPKHYSEAASCADSKQWEHLCIGRKRDAVDEFKEVLKAEYVTENGPVISFVGMEFTRNREARTGFISMKKYMVKMIENFENENGNAVDTPNIMENDSEWDMQPTKSSEVTVMQTQSYRSMIACLVWMSNNCRSKLALTVKKLLRHN